jgi:hypothetical protein
VRILRLKHLQMGRAADGDGVVLGVVGSGRSRP